ncbi:hypothetical protein ACFLT9_03115 [Acidobacteriota bacterium]
MSGYIYLVEKASHVSLLLKRGETDIVWVALSPEVMWELDERKISYNLPEDYINNTELGKTCLGYREKLDTLCRRIDEQILDKSPDFRTWGVQPLLFNFMPLTMMIDSLAGRILQLSAILNSYPHSTIVVFRNTKNIWSKEGILFSNKCSLWAEILTISDWNRKIEFIIETRSFLLISGLFFGRLKSIHSNLKELSHRSFLLTNFFINRKNGRSNAAKNSSNRVYLSHQSPGEWRAVIPHFLKNGVKIIYTNNNMFHSRKVSRAKTPVEEFDSIMRELDIEDLFTVSGINFYPLISEKIIRLCSQVFAYSLNVERKLKRILNKYKIEALLTTNSLDFQGHVVEQIVRSNNVPVIRWQHGFMFEQYGRLAQLNEYNNMMTSDMVYTFGEAVTAAHQLHQQTFPVNITSMGSTSLDKIVSYSKEFPEEFSPKLLYVTTNYYKNLWYCGFYPPFNDRLLFKDQIAIRNMLLRLLEIQRLELTVKLSPSSYFELPFAVTGKMNVLKDKANFTNLLLHNHVIIIDSPTTTLLQAISTKKPIFVLMNHIQYPEEARKLLERRAVCVDSVKELDGHLENYLIKKEYQADVHNDRFLEKYGTYLNDGSCDVRAFHETENLINKKMKIEK